MSELPMICATLKSDDGGWMNRWVWKGERLSLDLPDGRVTLHFRDTNAKGDLFVSVTHERIRQGLCRFERTPAQASRGGDQ